MAEVLAQHKSLQGYVLRAIVSKSVLESNGKMQHKPKSVRLFGPV